jgi:cytochrome c-type biogenesis protein CcmF
VLAVGLGAFACGGATRQLLLAVRSRGLRGMVGRSSGGMVVHVGVAVVAVAFACSSSSVRQAEVRFTEPGDRAVVAGHELVFDGVEEVQRSEKSEVLVRVLLDGDAYTPAVTFFPFAGQTIGTPTTRSTWWDDVQLSVLAVPEEPGDAAVVRVTVQPLVWWIWVGGAVMAVGTLLAVVPDRRRRDEEAPEAPVAEEGVEA